MAHTGYQRLPWWDPCCPQLTLCVFPPRCKSLAPPICSCPFQCLSKLHVVNAAFIIYQQKQMLSLVKCWAMTGLPGLTIRRRFLATRPAKFKSSFQQTTVECKKKKPNCFCPSFVCCIWKQKKDFMCKAYHRKGPDRANQKAPFSSVFSLRSGEKYRIFFTSK